MATTEIWLPHPATDTRFIVNGKSTRFEGDVFDVPKGATRCIKNYDFPPGTYRWTLPVSAALAKVLVKAGKAPMTMSPALDAAGISGGKMLPDGTYNRQPNFPVTDAQMGLRYERLLVK